MEIKYLLDIYEGVISEVGITGGVVLTLLLVFILFFGKMLFNRWKKKCQLEYEHKSNMLRYKIELYMEVYQPVNELVVNVLYNNDLPRYELEEHLKEFELKRLSSTALLGMFGSREVFEEYNKMMDYLFNSIEKKEDWSFSEYRKKGLIFLTKVRRDIGLYNDELKYKGTR